MAHKALEIRYPPGSKRGPHPAETFAELYDANASDFDQWDAEGNRVSARDLGIAMMNGYVLKWGEDEDIEIIGPEMAFQITILDEAGDYLCTFVGRFDALGRSRKTGRLFVFEHKTAKVIKEVRINSGYGEQGLAYWWAANKFLRSIGELPKGKIIDGVKFNFLRKAMPDERPRNAAGHYLNKPSKDALVMACEAHGLSAKGTIPVLADRLLGEGVEVELLGEVSKVQPPAHFDRQEMILGVNEARRFETRLRQEAREMARVRAGELDIFKNPSEDCSWKCPFVGACEVHEMGGDHEGILEMDTKAWNPYSDHELLEEKGRSV